MLEKLFKNMLKINFHLGKKICVGLKPCLWAPAGAHYTLPTHNGHGHFKIRMTGINRGWSMSKEKRMFLTPFIFNAAQPQTLD